MHICSQKYRCCGKDQLHHILRRDKQYGKYNLIVGAMMDEPGKSYFRSTNGKASFLLNKINTPIHFIHNATKACSVGMKLLTRYIPPIGKIVKLQSKINDKKVHYSTYAEKERE